MIKIRKNIEIIYSHHNLVYRNIGWKINVKTIICKIKILILMLKIQIQIQILAIIHIKIITYCRNKQKFIQEYKINKLN